LSSNYVLEKIQYRDITAEEQNRNGNISDDLSDR